MHSFLADASRISDNIVVLDEDESRHAVKVMRLKQADEIVISDGVGGRYLARTLTCESRSVSAEIIRRLPSNESTLNLTVLMGCLKSDKLESAVNQLTQLGVSAIIPVNMSRCVAADKRSDRLEKIAREAVKQSRRARVPSISPAIDWEKAVEAISSSELALMPWEECEGLRARDVYEKMPDCREITILIGPEGGITGSEADDARRAGAVAVTLGRRILRAETAAAATAALVQGLWGDI
ncbi:MAG: RsmE family RNA methyltransferase [Clostridia bacterium]|nr:RsmE family RNA methyltransferase [Clostridia bacterium]